MDETLRRLSTSAALLIHFVLLMAKPSHSQEKTVTLLLKVDQTSTGPYAGQKGSLCLRVYSNGRISDAEWSRAGVIVTDETGKKTRPEKTVSFEYQVPEKDIWEIGELEDFVKSKPVRASRRSSEFVNTMLLHSSRERSTLLPS